MGICLIAAVLSSGCQIIRGAAYLPGDAVSVVIPGKKKSNAIDLVELQNQLMRFADGYSARMVLASEKLRHGTNVLDRVEYLKWKTAYTGEIWRIASGQSALANLLDMIVVVTLSRMTIEDYYIPHVYGDSARRLLEVCREAEVELSMIAASVLTPEQSKELGEEIAAYHQQNPDPENVVFTRAISFHESLKQIQTRKAGSTREGPDSVFQLLMIDPLSGLDPAARELAHTRLFGERAMYLAQRMPYMLRWQTEWWTLNTLEMPEVRQLLTNTARLTDSIGRVSTVAQALPDQLKAERKAILDSLESQAADLTALAQESRLAFTAASQMASNAQGALVAFNAVLKQLDSGPPHTNANAEPFRIDDYTRAGAQLEQTAGRLEGLLQTFDRTVGSTNLVLLKTQIEQALQQAASGGKEVGDYAFRQGLVLVTVACGLVLATALIYRRLGPRPPPSAKTNSSSV